MKQAPDGSISVARLGGNELTQHSGVDCLITERAVAGNALRYSLWKSNQDRLRASPASRSVTTPVIVQQDATRFWRMMAENIRNGRDIDRMERDIVSNVFVSFAQLDREFVERLMTDLESRLSDSVTLYIDKALEPGDSWANTLVEALSRADTILLALSPAYLASSWAKKESTIAMWRASVDEKCRVIPFLIRPCEPSEFLKLHQSVDFTVDYDVGLERLVRALREPQTATLESLTPGETETIDPEELRRIRDELREAVELFRSRPEEQAARSERKVTSETPTKCFVVMPFGDEDLEVVYEDFIKPVVENGCRLSCERGDDVFGSNVVMDDILSSIQDSDVVLADLTRKNANVFYEVGICHALGKRVLLLAQSIDDVPFDLRHLRVLLYDYTPRGCKKLELDLKPNILAVLD